MGEFFLEAILAVLVAIVVAVVRLVWGHWQCEVVDPDGRVDRIRAGSLGDARARRDEIVASISAGARRAGDGTAFGSHS
jgi:hypothetical protein